MISTQLSGYRVRLLPDRISFDTVPLFLREFVSHLFFLLMNARLSAVLRLHLGSPRSRVVRIARLFCTVLYWMYL